MGPRGGCRGRAEAVGAARTAPLLPLQPALGRREGDRAPPRLAARCHRGSAASRGRAQNGGGGEAAAHRFRRGFSGLCRRDASVLSTLFCGACRA